MPPVVWHVGVHAARAATDWRRGLQANNLWYLCWYFSGTERTEYHCKHYRRTPVIRQATQHSKGPVDSIHSSNMRCTHR